jgi:hypothetical protein
MKIFNQIKILGNLFKKGGINLYLIIYNSI